MVMKCYTTEHKCYCGGLERDLNGTPLFKNSFEYGWAGGIFNSTGNGMSVGDYGSLIYCNWSLNYLENGEFIVNGDLARLWVIVNDEPKQVIGFIEFHEFISAHGIDGEYYNVSLCDPLVVEWL